MRATCDLDDMFSKDIVSGDFAASLQRVWPGPD